MLSGAPHLRAGRSAEHFARRWLEQKGLTFIRSNFRCRSGEIDLIMQDGPCLVIIEVRYRANERFGGAAASISRGKQRRLELATRYFLQQHPCWALFPLRFDVLALSGAVTRWQADWRRNAFESDEP